MIEYTTKLIYAFHNMGPYFTRRNGSARSEFFSTRRIATTGIVPGGVALNLKLISHLAWLIINKSSCLAARSKTSCLAPSSYITIPSDPLTFPHQFSPKYEFRAQSHVL